MTMWPPDGAAAAIPRPAVRQEVHRYLLELAFNDPTRSTTRPEPAPKGAGRGGSGILWFNFFRVGYPKALEIQLFSGQYPKKMKKPESMSRISLMREIRDIEGDA